MTSIHFCQVLLISRLAFGAYFSLSNHFNNYDVALVPSQHVTKLSVAVDTYEYLMGGRLLVDLG